MTNETLTLNSGLVNVGNGSTLYLDYSWRVPEDFIVVAGDPRGQLDRLLPGENYTFGLKLQAVSSETLELGSLRVDFEDAAGREYKNTAPGPSVAIMQRSDSTTMMLTTVGQR